MSELSQIFCETYDASHTGSWQRKLPTSTFHETTTDAAQSSEMEATPGFQYPEQVYDDTTGRYKLLSLDSYNLPNSNSYGESLTNYVNPSYLEAENDHLDRCLDHNFVAEPMSSQGSVNSIFSHTRVMHCSSFGSQHSSFSETMQDYNFEQDEYKYEPVFPEQEEYSQSQQVYSQQDYSQSPQAYNYSQAPSYPYDVSMTSEKATFEVTLVSPKVPQESTFGIKLEDNHESKVYLPPSPPGSDLHSSLLSAVTPQVSTPPEESQVDPKLRQRQGSLFSPASKRPRSNSKNKVVVQPPRVPKVPKRHKVVDLEPPVNEFVWDPNFRYDPIETPPNEEAALIMSYLKPCKEGQVMRIKENKREGWTRTAKSPKDSYVDLLLSSDVLITRLFKYKKGPIACSHCTIDFENYMTMCVHMDRFKIARDARCGVPYCIGSVVGFATSSELSRHTKAQHGNETSWCSERGCPYQSPRIDCMKRHYLTTHGLVVDTSHCMKWMGPKDKPPYGDDISTGTKKPSKALTDAEVQQRAAPVLVKLREMRERRQREMRQSRQLAKGPYDEGF